jgi:hypothetical protein
MNWKALALMACLVHATNAAAADCSQSLTRTEVEKLSTAVAAAQKNLSQHGQSLFEEQGVMLDRGPGNYSSIAFGKISDDQTRLTRADFAATTVASALDQVLTLIMVRDLMVDTQDKLTVETFLSVDAYGVGLHSRNAALYLNQARVSRPGIASDLAKLRDSVSGVSAAFENCDKPERRR